MSRKRVLFVMNPCAGQKRANRRLTEIIGTFCDNGYAPLTMITGKAGDGRLFAREYAAQADLVVCVGGDGTLNEIVSGVLECGAQTPIGYIPAGTTNDLANTLGLSRDIDQAVWDILMGTPTPLDVGTFNGRYFLYTASFGAFTSASYNTSQSAKNALGHLAYILEGIMDLPQLQPVNLKIEADGRKYEGEYLFGAISNSTSIGGILTLDAETVMLSDGRFELLLVDMPKTALDVSQIILSVTRKEYSGLIHLDSVQQVDVEVTRPLEWTLDGEYEAGCKRISIRNLASAVRLITRKHTNLLS